MKRNILVLSIATLLAGCGGGDSGGGSSSSSNTAPSIPPTGTFVAYNGLAIIKPNENVKIDLRNYVEQGIEIVSMSMRTEEGCPTPEEIDAMTFAVTLNEAAFCSYDYEVKSDVGKSGSATINVFATEAETPTLPGGSIALSAGDAAHTIDISTFVDGWSASHSIENTQVIVGEYGEVGGLTHAGQILTYTPPTVAGWNSILYTVVDATNLNLKQLGTIHVTISEDVNDAPVIDNTKYEYTGSVIASQSVTIDLATLPNLGITDDGDWQLIDVQSYTANVAELDPDSTSNKQFTFITPTVGKHVVSYTVTDHMGGFATGLINITVLPNEQAKSWTDLRTTIGSYEVTFSAAPLYSEVIAKNMVVETYWDTVVENTIAAFENETQAELFCSDVGRIPKVSEFDTLRDKGMANALLAGSYQSIPKELNYLTVSDTDLIFKLYDFNSGIETTLTGTEIFYVTCANFNSFEVDILTTNLVAGSDDHTIAIIKKAANETLSAVVVPEIASRLTASDVNLTIDNSDPSAVVIKANSTVSGAFRLQIDSSAESITTAEFNVLADRNTSSIAVDASADDKDASNQIYLVADGVDQLELLTHVTDQYSNDVAEVAVFYSGGSDGLVTNNSNIELTDGVGQTSFILTGDINETFKGGTYSKTYTYDLIVGQQTTPFTFELKHANFYDTVQLITFAPDGNTIPATIQVLSRAGVPRAATIEVTGGVRGSIIHPGTFGEFENDILQRINVPAEGAAVWLTTAIDNTPGGFTFELTGSPNSAIASVPASPRVMAQLSLNSSSPATDAFADNVRLFLDTADSLEVLRGASAAPNTVYLPQLRADEKGKTVFMINAGQNTFTVHPDASDLSVSYSMLSASFTSKICHTRTYYWDGTKWMVLAPSLVPLPSVYWPNCANSDIYQ